ncbi:hypothetical protein ACH4U6_00035 [Streptomyces netropsis]
MVINIFFRVRVPGIPGPRRGVFAGRARVGVARGAADGVGAREMVTDA